MLLVEAQWLRPWLSVLDIHFFTFIRYRTLSLPPATQPDLVQKLTDIGAPSVISARGILQIAISGDT